MAEAKRRLNLTEAPEPPAAEAGFQRVDMSKPFALVYHETDTRRNVEVIQDGEDTLATAKARASQKAARTGERCVVCMPVSILAPPPKPVAEEVQVDWLKG
jgi:hypothetical protein